MKKIMVKVFLDDMRRPEDIYRDGEEWMLVDTTTKVKELLKTGQVSHLSLDNDLGLFEPEGHTVVTWMIENNIWPTEEIFVHSANIVRSSQMRADVICYFYNCAKRVMKR